MISGGKFMTRKLQTPQLPNTKYEKGRHTKEMITAAMIKDRLR